jgi:hypothetical protein
MNKLIIRLKDERTLLLLAYCFSVLNILFVNFVNVALLSNQNEVLTMWLPIMRVVSSVASILTVLAILTFIFKKAPKFKWIGYTLLFMTVISIAFMSNNALLNADSLQQPFYIVLTSIHMFLNIMIAYLVVSYHFCSRKFFNYVIALKFISSSLRMGLPVISVFFSSGIIRVITIVLMNTDMILRIMVIVVLLLSILYKPNENLLENNQ